LEHSGNSEFPGPIGKAKGWKKHSTNALVITSRLLSFDINSEKNHFNTVLYDLIIPSSKKIYAPPTTTEMMLCSVLSKHGSQPTWSLKIDP